MAGWSRIRYNPNIPLYPDRERVTGGREHIRISKDAAKEGMVLLKNDNKALPLKKGSRLVLIGKATLDYVKGGGGSGDVTVAYSRNLYEGIKIYDKTTEIFEPLIHFYKENLAEQYSNGAAPGLTKEPVLPEELLKRSAEFSDVAVLSFCRYSGEGWDRSCSIEGKELHMENLEKDVWGEDAMRVMAKKVFPKGDFYLNAGEEKLLELTAGK
ncbi:MAG: glycoside hydrolase family 3 C-terminal domain-containing protein, partial [Parasporobacterium sp.]|nr:glycoside hydrolase family 3 C-terminal domain-containing protein [Parasporobacterium sp.]